jgi:DNA-directed RNA polymerase specialized sigma24 family protein
VRGARDLRDEFSTFHASAYPQLAAQTLAITGDAGITRAAAATTLARVWRSWPSLRGTADVLVRARWTAVLVAAERESITPVRPRQAGDAVQEITGAAVPADTVVVSALQRLPRVQRRALVLYYMGGVSVRHLSELSGSSAEHIELLLDDGFTALAATLDWSGPNVVETGGRHGPDLRFDWVAEALSETAARLPEQIPAPLPEALLRNAAAVRWSVRAIPVAAVAACAAVIAAVAPPEPPGLHAPAASAVSAVHGGDTVAALAPVSRPEPGPALAVEGSAQPGPSVRLRSIALTSLLDTPRRAAAAADVDSGRRAQNSRAERGPAPPPAPSSVTQGVAAPRAEVAPAAEKARRPRGSGGAKAAEPSTAPKPGAEAAPNVLPGPATPPAPAARAVAQAPVLGPQAVNVPMPPPGAPAEVIAAPALPRVESATSAPSLPPAGAPPEDVLDLREVPGQADGAAPSVPIGKAIAEPAPTGRPQPARASTTPETAREDRPPAVEKAATGRTAEARAPGSRGRDGKHDDGEQRGHRDRSPATDG